MYKIQGGKHLKLFELPPDSVAVALGIIKAEPPTRPLVKFDKQVLVEESRWYAEAPFFLLIKRKDAVFAVSPSTFRDSVCISISVLRVRASISMTLPQPKMRKRSFMNSPRVLLPTTPVKKGAFLR